MLNTYPPRAYKLVREAIQEAGTTKTWEVFQALYRVIGRNHGERVPVVTIAKNAGLEYISDLENVIKVIKEEGS